MTAQAERSAVSTDRAAPAVGPYSQAIRAGGFVFVAGQIGLDPVSGELAAGVEGQAEQALANLEAVLAAAGSGIDLVTKTTVFIADMDDFATVNEVYGRHLRQPYPARSTVAVKQLPRGALVEVEAIALAPDAG